MSLVDKIRKARETQVAVGGFTFTVRRPTDVEALELRDAHGMAEMMRFITGWALVREIDLIPGGSPTDVPFDAALASEWLADRPDLLTPLVSAVHEQYRAHVVALGEVAKN